MPRCTAACTAGHSREGSASGWDVDQESESASESGGVSGSGWVVVVGVVGGRTIPSARR